MSLVHLSPGKQAPEVVNAVVEIPTGSRIKYEIDHHTGLGLAVCHRILVAHGGLLFLESLEGRGTTVHLRLPA